LSVGEAAGLAATLARGVGLVRGVAALAALGAAALGAAAFMGAGAATAHCAPNAMHSAQRRLLPAKTIRLLYWFI
jgi:hypothetical protein